MGYQSNTIKVLTTIEGIQQRPGMYIGSTYSPNQLVQEVLDNALDELINGYANTVTLNIDNITNQIIVTDNGRGIPIHNIKMEHGEVVDSIIATCTALHSGAKFDNNSYEFSAGMHGVGLVAVNALSMAMNIYVVKNGTLFTYKFLNGKISEHTATPAHDDILWSTAIEFYPNPNFFTVSDIDIDKFKKKLHLIKAKYPKSIIQINNKRLSPISMEEFACYQMNYDVIVDDKELGHVFYKEPNGKFVLDLYFTFNPNKQLISEGDVNCIMCTGTYLTNLETMFYNAISQTIKEPIPRNLISNNIQFYASILMKNPSFESQIKSRLSTVIRNYLPPVQKEISRIFRAPFLPFKDKLNTIIENYKKRKLSSIIKVAVKKISPENPAYDSRTIPGNTLYILEGESASGTMKQVRNPQTEGIYPLSGKILNIEKASDEQLINSKKFKYFIETIGVDFRKKTQRSFRYDKIKILTDSDSDGAHIAVLILLALWKFCKQLIVEQRVEIATPPLYGTYINNQFIPIFTESDRSKYASSHNVQITRFKGIGEMNPDQLEVIIRDPKYSYVVQPPINSKIESSIISCVTDTQVKRAICNQPDLTMDRFFERVVNI